MSKVKEQYDVPVVLTRKEILLLAELYEDAWGAKNNWWRYLIGNERIARKLAKYGYVELELVPPNSSAFKKTYHARITNDGLDRLEAPMRLCRYELGEAIPRMDRSKVKLKRVK